MIKSNLTSTGVSYIPGTPSPEISPPIATPPTEQSGPVLQPPNLPVIEVPKPIFVGPPAFPVPVPAPHTAGSDAYMQNLQAWLRAVTDWERTTFNQWQNLVVKDGGATTYGNESAYRQWIANLQTYLKLKNANQVAIDRTSGMPILPTPPPSNKLPYHDSIISQVPSEVFSATDMGGDIGGISGILPGGSIGGNGNGTTPPQAPGNYGYYLNQYIDVLKEWAKIYISEQTAQIPQPVAKTGVANCHTRRQLP